jgi:hypothetical protein
MANSSHVIIITEDLSILCRYCPLSQKYFFTAFFFLYIRSTLTLMNSMNSGSHPPDDINVIIEIPKGSNIKYEIDIESGLLLVE